MELNISDIIFAAINFLVMAGILSALLFRPVLKILDTRRSKIAAADAEADKLLAEATALQTSREQELLAAQHKAASLVRDAVRESKLQSLSMIADAKAESEQIYKNMRSDLALEKERLMSELNNEAVRLAVRMARKILETQVTVSSSNRIEEFSAQLSAPEAVAKIQKKLASSSPQPTIEIVTSSPLSEQERTLMNEILSQAGVSNIPLFEAISDELMGGAILFIGDLMFDGSVSNRLNNISKEMLLN